MKNFNTRLVFPRYLTATAADIILNQTFLLLYRLHMCCHSHMNVHIAALNIHILWIALCCLCWLNTGIVRSCNANGCLRQNSPQTANFATRPATRKLASPFGSHLLYHSDTQALTGFLFTRMVSIQLHCLSNITSVHPLVSGFGPGISREWDTVLATLLALWPESSCMSKLV